MFRQTVSVFEYICLFSVHPLLPVVPAGGFRNYTSRAYGAASTNCSLQRTLGLKPLGTQPIQAVDACKGRDQISLKKNHFCQS